MGSFPFCKEIIKKSLGLGFGIDDLGLGIWNLGFGI